MSEKGIMAIGCLFAWIFLVLLAFETYHLPSRLKQAENTWHEYQYVVTDSVFNDTTLIIPKDRERILIKDCHFVMSDLKDNYAIDLE